MLRSFSLSLKILLAPVFIGFIYPTDPAVPSVGSASESTIKGAVEIFWRNRAHFFEGGYQPERMEDSFKLIINKRGYEFAVKVFEAATGMFGNNIEHSSHEARSIYDHTSRLFFSYGDINPLFGRLFVYSLPSKKRLGDFAVLADDLKAHAPELSKTLTKWLFDQRIAILDVGLDDDAICTQIYGIFSEWILKNTPSPDTSASALTFDQQIVSKLRKPLIALETVKHKAFLQKKAIDEEDENLMDFFRDLFSDYYKRKEKEKETDIESVRANIREQIRANIREQIKAIRSTLSHDTVSERFTNFIQNSKRIMPYYEDTLKEFTIEFVVALTKVAPPGTFSTHPSQPSTEEVGEEIFMLLWEKHELGITNSKKGRQEKKGILEALSKIRRKHGEVYDEALKLAESKLSTYLEALPSARAVTSTPAVAESIDETLRKAGLLDADSPPEKAATADPSKAAATALARTKRVRDVSEALYVLLLRKEEARKMLSITKSKREGILRGRGIEDEINALKRRSSEVFEEAKKIAQRNLEEKIEADNIEARAAEEAAALKAALKAAEAKKALEAAIAEKRAKDFAAFAAEDEKRRRAKAAAEKAEKERKRLEREEAAKAAEAAAEKERAEALVKAAVAQPKAEEKETTKATSRFNADARVFTPGLHPDSPAEPAAGGAGSEIETASLESRSAHGSVDGRDDSSRTDTSAFSEHSLEQTGTGMIAPTPPAYVPPIDARFIMPFLATHVDPGFLNTLFAQLVKTASPYYTVDYQASLAACITVHLPGYSQEAFPIQFIKLLRDDYYFSYMSDLERALKDRIIPSAPSDHKMKQQNFNVWVINIINEVRGQTLYTLATKVRDSGYYQLVPCST